MHLLCGKITGSVYTGTPVNPQKRLHVEYRSKRPWEGWVAALIRENVHSAPVRKGALKSLSRAQRGSFRVPVLKNKMHYKDASKRAWDGVH